MHFCTVVCPKINGSHGHKHGYKMLVCLVIVVSLIVDIIGNLDESITCYNKFLITFIICNSDNISCAYFFK